MSIDGFIARKNDDIHWLTEASQNIGNDSEKYGYENFYKIIDTIVLESYANNFILMDQKNYILIEE